MKRVSFKVAKALKEAGYPQDYIETWYYGDKKIHHIDDPYVESTTRLFRAPTYLEAWLWLWREKNIQIDVDYTDNDSSTASILIEGEYLFDFFTEKDPEDALEQVIEYLVEHNLIK